VISVAQLKTVPQIIVENKKKCTLRSGFSRKLFTTSYFNYYFMEEEKKYVSIKNWHESDKPREKMANGGCAVLSDAELLAILLGIGTYGKSAVDLAKDILAKYNNNLSELAKLSINDLKNNFKGIGEAKAVSIVAALELGRRQRLSEAFDKKKIINVSDAAIIFTELLSDLPHEEFWILLLNRGNYPISKQRISSGGVSETVVDVKIVMKLAIENLASSIILGHNHPSGNLAPSSQDVELTKRIDAACKILGINLFDHIIVADNKWISLFKEGFMNN